MKRKADEHHDGDVIRNDEHIHYSIPLLLRYIRSTWIVKHQSQDSIYGTPLNPTYYDVLDLLSSEEFRENTPFLSFARNIMFGVLEHFRASTLEDILQYIHEALKNKQ